MKRPFTNGSYALISILGGSLLAILIWGSFRGLDLTDESYYLLKYRNPIGQPPNISYFYYFFPRLFPNAGYDIVGLRGLKIFINLLFALLLSTLACRMDDAGNELPRLQRLSASAMFFIGLSLPASWLPQTPSYNDLVNWGLALLFSGYLALSTNTLRGEKILAGVCFGLAIPSLFFIKAPASILATVLATACILLNPTATKAVRSHAFIFSLFITLSLFVAWFSWRIKPVNQALIEIWGLVRSIDGRHQAPSLIPIYVKSAHRFANGIITMLFLPSVCFYLAARKFGRNRLIQTIFVLLGLALIIGTAYKLRVWLPFTLDSQPTVAFYTIACGSIILIFFSNTSNPKRLTGLWVFAVCLPLVGSAGTNIPVFEHSIIHVFSLFVLTFMLFKNQTVAPVRPWLALTRIAMPFGLVTLALSQIIIGNIFYPYRLAGSLFTQTISLPHFEPLKVDSPTVKFQQDISRAFARSSISRNQKVMAFYDIPGALLLADRKSVGDVWYFGSAEERTCESVNHLDQQNPPPIILTNQPIENKVLGCLERVGINFAKDYSLQTTFSQPNEKKRVLNFWKHR